MSILLDRPQTDITVEPDRARPKTRAQRLDSLTSLRFLAALMVVAHHTAFYFTGKMWALKTVQFGFTGVTFFFILSGFVLTWSHNEDDKAHRFYWRRFCRIYPLHLAMLFVAGAVLSGQFTQGSNMKWPSVLLLQSWSTADSVASAFNGVSWTLCCEAFFYLLFPFIVPLLKRLNNRALIGLNGVAFALSVALSVTAWKVLEFDHAFVITQKNPLLRLPEFVLGISLALIVQRGWRCRVSLSTAFGAVFVALLVISMAFTAGRATAYIDLASQYMAPWYGLLIVAAVSAELRGGAKLWRNPVLVMLGNASFALYMIHYVPSLWVRDFLPGIHSLGLNLVLWASFMAACVMASVAVYLYFERPIERALRRLAFRR